mmetsp:Transcript_32837/g.106157  ORF Transcript_32837/g.106157 Transcript_32837/m.106157 type:complete len:100 (+) Transcript_32837:418-717(+)
MSRKLLCLDPGSTRHADGSRSFVGLSSMGDNECCLSMLLRRILGSAASAFLAAGLPDIGEPSCPCQLRIGTADTLRAGMLVMLRSLNKSSMLSSEGRAC